MKDLGEPRDVSFEPALSKGTAPKGALCDTIIARLARFLIKLHHYPAPLRAGISSVKCYTFHMSERRSRTLLWILIGGGAFFLFVLAVFTLVYLTLHASGTQAGQVVTLAGVSLPAYDPLAWAKRRGIAADKAASAFLDLLLQGECDDEARDLVLRAGRDGSADGLRKALQLIVHCPEYQLA